MKEVDIDGLDRGDWVLLRDGRKGRFQDIHTYSRENEFPWVVVNTPDEDGYGMDIRVWPNQVVKRTFK